MAQLRILSPLALLIAASPLAMAASQQESAGFLEDSSLSVTSRAIYYNLDQRNRAGNNPTIDSDADGEPDTGFLAGHGEEAGLGALVQYESGFTQGTVGFGVDAHLLSSVRLDSGKGRWAGDMFAADSNGNPQDSQSELGGAIKARVSSTVLKHGNLQVDTPVLSTDDTLLPEIATGSLLTSEDIEGVTLTAGRFTGLSSMIQTGRDDTRLTSANIFGINAELCENASGAFYASDVKDHFRKLYVNLNHKFALADEQELEVDFNAYRTKDQGLASSGPVDNRIWSLSAGWTVGAHTLTAGYQHSSGSTGYAYGVDGGGAVYLGNSVTYSDFMGADERSWRLRYDLDMEAFGVPGLTLATAYTQGDDIDQGAGVTAREQEFDVEIGYTVQEGAAKDLSILLENATYRATNGYDDDVNELRLSFEYPISVL